MKKYLIIAIVFIVLFGGVGALVQQNRKLRAERDRQFANVETLMDTVKQYKVRDSLNVASVGSLRLTVDELKSTGQKMPNLSKN